MAEAAFRPPSFTGNDANASQAWKEFKEDMANYMIAAGLKDADGERKVAILLYGLGSKYRRVYNNFQFAEVAHKTDYNRVVGKFDNHFEPKKVTKLYMKKFDSCMQRPGETIGEYVSNLRDIARYCDFGDTLDAQLCKQISSGVRSSTLRDKLWSEDLTLEQILAKCHLHEQKQESLEVIEGRSKTADVHYANQRGRGSTRGHSRGRRGNFPRVSRGRGNSTRQSQGATHSGQPRGRGQGAHRGGSSQRGSTCGNCGYTHATGQCPAYGKQCRYCKNMNHFDKVCRIKKRQVFSAVNENPDYYYEEAPQSDANNNNDAALFVYHTQCKSGPYVLNVKQPQKRVSHLSELNRINWIVNLELCDDKGQLPFKIDTGADCSCISLQTYRDYVKSGLVHSSTIISGISEPTVQPVGRVELRVMYNDKQYNIMCEVLDREIPCLVGLDDSLMMNLISRVDHAQGSDDTGAIDNMFLHVKCNYPESQAILAEYKDTFQGIGKIPGEVSLKIDPSVTPVAHPPRPVPEALRGAVKDKLDQMEKEGILEKIPPGAPTPWCAPMHTVLKKPKSKGLGPITKDDVRITIDPRDLNQALMREFHPINTLEQVITKTHGSKLFTKLDARQGFFQLALDYDSSLLTAFNTPYGRYRHKRLPMRISVAPEIYQRTMQDIFGSIEGCEVIFDDLLLHAPDLQSHNQLLRKVLQTARKHSVVFNVNKLYLCQPQVEYVGHILSGEGVKVSPDKVAAVVDMPQPQSISHVQTLLGMVTYTCKFLENLSSMTEPLRQLIKEAGSPGFQWHWDPCHQAAFEEVKQAMTSAPVLGYYTLDKPITLSVDASQSGLGAVLIQDGKPIHYASKALTPSEYNYAQIEKELLAIVWAYNKFHTYLYGRSDVTVETDHKPLVRLREKPLFQMPPRLQRMFAKIRHHTFTLIHKPGKEIPVSDCMSRLYQDDKPSADNTENIFTISTEEVRHTYSFSSRRLMEVREETKRDPALQKLISVLKSPHWPEQKSDLTPDVKPYFTFLEEMAIVDGIILKGERVVIPESMRREMLGIIHESHLGMVKCKQLARDVLYWPGLNKQIEDLVSRCATCQKYRRKQQKEPLLPTEVPHRPWQIVATDLFDLDGHKYLILTDYYSEWFEMEQLTTDSTATTVIGKMSKWFATHGIPEKVISDNGPPFNSYKFADFAGKYGFTHQTTSPYHSQANGLAEKVVGIAKRIIIKCAETKQDPYLALLNYRNTPRDGVGSPAQRLFGRRTCTRLPTADMLLNPVTQQPERVTERLMEDRTRAKSYYDKGSSNLQDLRSGDTIRVRSQQGTWEPAKLQPDQHPYRSHSVMLPNGRVYRRNRRDILKTREDPHLFERSFNPDLPTEEDEALPVEPEVARNTTGSPVNIPSSPPTTPNAPTSGPTFTDPNPPASAPPHTPIHVPTQVPTLVQPPVQQPQNVSRHGRIRKPNTRYDPRLYELGK